MENVNVVIVDDNPMILNTLDEVISSEAGLSVIGRADNGKDAIDMIKDTQPDNAADGWYYSCGKY